MGNQKDRVIIDTNLWISFLLTKDFTKFDTIIADEKLVLIFSQELIDEIVEVTQSIKFRKYFPLDDIERLLLKISGKTIRNINNALVGRSVIVLANSLRPV